MYPGFNVWILVELIKEDISMGTYKPPPLLADWEQKDWLAKEPEKLPLEKNLESQNERTS